MSKKRIAVFMGGWSPEREVSLQSGTSVLKALHEMGYDAIKVDVTRDINKLMADLSPKPDIIFNILHGKGGEDGIIQGVCEFLQIPYTFSNVLASAVAMDKILSRKIFKESGFLVPNGKVIPFKELASHPFNLPYVLKPINAGSSVGIKIVKSDQDLEDFKKEWVYGKDVLAEEFIKGREIQVAYLGDKAIGAIEICPKTEFYDYKAKYTPGFAEHLMPAPIKQESYDKVLDITARANKVLRCRGLTRSDFLYNEEEDNFYLLEVNTQPGMTQLSLCQEIASYCGITFHELLQTIIDQAQCDQ